MEQESSILFSSNAFRRIGGSNNSVVYEMASKDTKKASQNKKAFKLVPHDQSHSHSRECAHLSNEFALLSKIAHSNIISFEQFHDSIQNNKKTFCAVTMELAKLDLFSLIQKLYPSTLDICFFRGQLKKIVNALEYCHSEQDIAHNDVKLENIFIFENYEPKLADFGFAHTLGKKTGQVDTALQQYQRWLNRNPKNLSPEAFKLLNDQKTSFDESKSDVFALGVTMFQGIFLRNPWVGDCHSEADSLFKFMHSKDYLAFWNSDLLKPMLGYWKNKNGSEMSQLIDLLIRMLLPDPKDRISMKEVQAHAWFNGPIVNGNGNRLN